MKNILIISLLFFVLNSCINQIRWTEEEKKKFAEKCSITDTTDGFVFFLTGFQFNEIKNILVRQIHNGKTVDSFYIHPNKHTFDSLRTRYTANIDRPLYIKDTFQFIINDHPPFVLSDMKMVMWSQYTQFSEGYGCVMGDFKINGVRFEHVGNPDFRKKGFKFSWEK